VIEEHSNSADSNNVTGRVVLLGATGSSSNGMLTFVACGADGGVSHRQELLRQQLLQCMTGTAAVACGML
jgi:hypothetical protein